MTGAALQGIVLCSVFFLFPTAHAACPPAGTTADSLKALEIRDFELSDTRARNELAIGLAACLGQPDPELRDGIAFEGLAAWMRKGQLETSTLRSLLGRLVPMLGSDDPQGFQRPFASLVLSEVARTDRLQPWMTPDERTRLVEAAAAYMASISDYRGFIDGQGWRHAVAHTADLELQLALSHDPADWEAWFARIAAPAPLPSWNDAFFSEAGLAKRHNTAEFLSMLYLVTQEQDDAATRERLLPGLRAAVKTVP